MKKNYKIILLSLLFIFLIGISSIYAAGWYGEVDTSNSPASGNGGLYFPLTGRNGQSTSKCFLFSDTDPGQIAGFAEWTYWEATSANYFEWSNPNTLVAPKGYYARNGKYPVKEGDRYYVYEFDSNGYAIRRNPELSAATEQEAAAMILNNGQYTINAATNGGRIGGSTQEYYITMPFSQLPQLGQGGNTTNSNGFNLVGIYMSRHIDSYEGNYDFLNNDDRINEYSELLSMCGYNSSEYLEWIKALKRLFKLQMEMFGNKSYMTLNPNNLKSIVQKKVYTTKNIFLDTLDVILRLFGVICFVYAFILVVCGIIDEGSFTDRSITSIITRGNLSRDGDNKAPKFVTENNRFRYAYLKTAILIIIIGFFCISASLRYAFISVIIKIVNWVTGLIPFFHN